jgi:integrase
MGLGSASIIGLADARTFAAQCRALVARRIDPIEERRRRQQQAALEAATAVTFKQAALSVIEAKRPSWRNAKHAAQWQSTLEAYAFHLFGHLPVRDVDTALVLRSLKPIWATKNSTAGRVRERIEAVLDAAKAEGLRTGENPARWKGHLEYKLAKPSKVQPVKHHAALPYPEIPAFMDQLRTHECVAAWAMEFLILTATRTSEAIGARWDEIDLEAGRWTIPGERIKAGKTHQIPLSEPALALLRRLQRLRVGEFVFPGLRPGKPLSNMAMLKLLDRMGRRYEITTHGFRSTFRDWAAEQTTHAGEVVEMALAHTIENKVEAAYRRGDLFEKRRFLMRDWGEYCEGRPVSTAVVRLALAS